MKKIVFYERKSIKSHTKMFHAASPLLTALYLRIGQLTKDQNINKRYHYPVFQALYSTQLLGTQNRAFWTVAPEHTKLTHPPYTLQI